MRLIETNFILATINRADARLYTKWLRSVTPEEFREGVKLFLKLVVEEKIELWIVDASRLHGITMADQHWIVNDIVPPLLKSRLRKIARIGSGDIFQYMSFEEMVERAIKNYKVDVEVAQFTSLAMAEAWIGMNE